MADNGHELRRIAWLQTFPFLRLFQTFRLTLNLQRTILALACLVLTYLGGRVLDGLWGERNGVLVATRADELQSQIAAYAEMGQTDYTAWAQQARAARDEIGIRALTEAHKAANAAEARQMLATKPLDKLLSADDPELAELRKLVKERLDKGRAAIKADSVASPADRDARRQTLEASADLLRVILATPSGSYNVSADHATAVRTITAADPAVPSAQQTTDMNRLTAGVQRQLAVHTHKRLTPRGPYIGLLNFEMKCVAGAVQGVLTGRWGFCAATLDEKPALAASVLAAGKGVWWMVTQRPWFTVLCGLWHLVVFAFFGGALCRSAAIQATRDHTISWGEAFRFSQDKFGGFALAPLIPVIGVVGIGLVMAVVGLLGAVPYLGELLVGLLYFLAIIGGFVMALLLLAAVLGFPLVWPTIAVEGSDGFDGMSRAWSYLTSRPWHLAFYALVLFLYGAASFTFVRLVAMLALKLSHSSTKLFMNMCASSSQVDGVGKLDAMWRMPAWGDLHLLPTTDPTPFWGHFWTVPTDGMEGLCGLLLSVWVFLVVGLVGAFLINFFFCGSTQMYLLLRRDLDATEYDEVYWEEPEEPAPAPAPVTPAPPAPPPPPPSVEPPANGTAGS